MSNLEIKLLIESLPEDERYLWNEFQYIMSRPPGIEDRFEQFLRLYEYFDDHFKKKYGPEENYLFD